jgi:hypothetical protein
MVITPAERRNVFVLLAALAGVYLRALNGQVLDWDDRIWLEDPALASPWLAVATTRDHIYAPLLRLTFALQHAAFGDWIPGYHLVDLLAWLAIVAGVWLLLRRLGLAATPALVATALWAFHPTKVECVAWLTGWKDLGSGLLLVVAALAATWGAGAALVTLLAAGAVLTKPATFPVIFVIAALVLAREGWPAARRVGPACAVALAAATGGMLAWSPNAPGESIAMHATRMAWVHGVFWEKLLPLGLPAAITPLTADPWPTIAIGALGTGSFAWLAWRDARLRLPLALWLLPQIPFLGLVDMAFWASDRHLLFPSLGVAVAVAQLAEPIGAPLLLVAVLLAVPTSLRVPEWRSSQALWEAEVTRPGDHPDRWFKLAMVYAEAGRFSESVAAWDRVLALRPQDHVALARRLVAALAADGSWSDADRAAALILAPTPATPDDWSRAADALERPGRPDHADRARHAVTR